jgi:hypothetical protein
MCIGNAWNAYLDVAYALSIQLADRRKQDKDYVIVYLARPEGTQTFSTQLFKHQQRIVLECSLEENGPHHLTGECSKGNGMFCGMAPIGCTSRISSASAPASRVSNRSGRATVTIVAHALSVLFITRTATIGDGPRFVIALCILFICVSFLVIWNSLVRGSLRRRRCRQKLETGVFEL